MSSVPSLLSAPGAGKPSRSASAVVAKATRGFQVFRIDGYSWSWTKALPGGEGITSEEFNVGGFLWHIDYYPNGTDGSNDSAASIAVYLRLQNTYKNERVRAQYKFSLLDLAGNEAYELPAETGIFRTTGHNSHGEVSPEDPGCGYASFITKEDLEKRRDSLLREDCLAIRCDVGVMELTTMAVGPKNGRSARTRNYGAGGGYGYGYAGGAESPDDEEDDGGSNKGRRGEPDDKEYIRRCLSTQRRK